MLIFGNRTGFSNGHLFAYFCCVPRIVDQEFFATFHVLLIFWMHHIAFNLNGDRVFHRRFNDNSLKEFPLLFSACWIILSF